MTQLFDEDKMISFAELPLKRVTPTVRVSQFLAMALSGACEVCQQYDYGRSCRKRAMVSQKAQDLSLETAQMCASL